MSDHDNALLIDEDEPAVTPAPPIRRINVAVTPAMIDAIDRVIENEQVSLTEAVRRLIGYGELVYRTTKENKEELIIRGPGGAERAIILL